MLAGLKTVGVSQTLSARVKTMIKRLTLLFLGLTFLFVALTIALQSQHPFPHTGTIVAIGAEVYKDVNCTQPLSQFEWGFVEPNETAYQVCYIKSTSNVNSTLTFTIENWNPENSSNYLTLSWNYDNSTLQPNEVIEVTFSLRVDSEINQAGHFSFCHDLSHKSRMLLAHMYQGCGVTR